MNQNAHNQNIEEYIKNLRESTTIELKESKNSLPKEFWSTFSAFSNTKGGQIFLGIQEAFPENIIHGVNNSSKIITDLWNTLSNPQKVSFNALKDSDIEILDVAGKQIIKISVPEADKMFKPVYLNGHYENSYIRKGEGDFKMTESQLRATLRNSRPIEDSLFIENMSIDDLDPISIASFKEKLSVRYPDKGFEKYSHKDFLERIGAIKIKPNDAIDIKNGTLLFFGKYAKIKEHFPSFFMDYVNRPEAAHRWIDRVSSDDLSDFQMNIYNFFNIVFEKLRLILMEKFELNSDSVRSKSSGFDIAIREALTNCLAHADYMQAFPSIKIEVSKGWISFRNPGEMLIPIDNFFRGGDSRPRNETIMSFFRYLGISERQGEGGPNMYRIAAENDFRLPDIITDLDHTELKLWYVDLSESYPNLTADEKAIYQFIYKNRTVVKLNDIRKFTGFTEYRVRKSLASLLDKKLIVVIGTGKATRYSISDPTQLFEKLKLAIDKLQQQI